MLAIVFAAVAVVIDKASEESGEGSQFGGTNASQEVGLSLLDPGDLRTTAQRVQRWFGQVPKANDIAMQSAVEELREECESFVGREVSWEMPVLRVTSEYVVFDGDASSHLKVSFGDADGLTPLEVVSRDYFAVDNLIGRSTMLRENMGEAAHTLYSESNRLHTRMKHLERIMGRRVVLGRPAWERWDYVSALKIGTEISKLQAGGLGEGTSVSIGGTIHEISVEPNKVTVKIRHGRSLERGFEYRFEPTVTKPRLLTLEECQRIVNEYRRSSGTYSSEIAANEEWTEPVIARFGYGRHLVKPQLPANLLANAVIVGVPAEPDPSAAASWRVYWILDGGVAHVEAYFSNSQGRRFLLLETQR